MKQDYQRRLNQAYQAAPFTIERVIDLKDPIYLHISRYCEVCGNRRIRFLCQAIDKAGNTWNIGRDCWTEIYNRQFEDRKHRNT